MTDNLHSPVRRLIELRIEHADLDSLIDRSAAELPADDLTMRRLKKRRLALMCPKGPVARCGRILDMLPENSPGL